MFAQKIPRLGVGRGTGHDRQRHVAAESPAHGPQLSKQQFEQAGLRDRAHPVKPFRPGAAEPGALTTCDKNRADGSRGQRLFATGSGHGRRDGIFCSAQPQAGRSDGPGQLDRGRQDRGGLSSEPLEFRKLPPVDQGQLAQEPCPTGGVEPIPGGEHVRLAGRCELPGKRLGDGRCGFGSFAITHPRTHHQNRKQSSGKPIKITP